MTRFSYGRFAYAPAGAPGDRLALRVTVLAVALYLVHAVYAVATHRALYGDTAWFLLMIATGGDVASFYSDFATQFYFSRFLAYGTTQLPAVVAMRLGVDSLPVLSFFLGAGFFSHKIISLLACHRLLPRGEKFLIVFPLLGLFAGTINSEIYIVTETHLAVSLFWPLLVALTRVEPRSWKYFAATGAGLLAFPFVYESAALFCPALLAIILFRAWQANARHAIAPWLGLAVAAVAGSAVGWMAILFPRDPNNRAAFLDGIHRLYRESFSIASLHIGPLVSLAVLAIVGVLLFIALGRRGHLARIPAFAAAGLVALLPLAHFLAHPAAVDFTAAITDRAFSGLLSQFVVMAMYLAALAGAPALNRNLAGIAALVAALVAGQIGWQLMATRSWQKALEGVKTTVSTQSGLLPCSAMVLPASPEPFVARPDWTLCHWWVLPLSVIMSPERNVQALLESSETYRPFDPRSRADLPATVFAPVSYDRYLARLSSGGELVGGRTLGFAQSGPGTALLGSGFSTPEHWGTWTEGSSANLRICQPGTGPMRPSFFVTPLLVPSRPRLTARVSANGVFVSEWRFALGQPLSRRSVVLNRSVLDPDGCADLRFELDDITPAAELIPTEDRRRLGLGFVDVFLPSAGQDAEPGSR